MLSLVVFMFSQSILPNMMAEEEDKRYLLLIFFGRLLNYAHTMVRLFCVHGVRTVREYRAWNVFFVFKIVPVPAYLQHSYDKASLLLLIFMLLMCLHEPIFICLTDENEEFPSYICESSLEYEGQYSIFTALAMAIHWGLLIDVAVFSNAFSAFVLVCGNVMSEISRFLISISFLIVTFGSAISMLDHG